MPRSLQSFAKSGQSRRLWHNVAAVFMLAACGTRLPAGIGPGAGSASAPSAAGGAKFYSFHPFPSDDIALDACERNVVNMEHWGLVLGLNTNCGPRLRTFKHYHSGRFTARMQLPSGHAPGVVSSFYLSSQEGDPTRSEIDMEFLGRYPQRLQTNYFVDGDGHNEMWHELGFDPSASPHDYTIDLNASRILWYVDGRLIRQVDHQGTKPFPNKDQAVYTSIWDASSHDSWAGSVNWAKAPFWLSVNNLSIDGF